MHGGRSGGPQGRSNVLSSLLSRYPSGVMGNFYTNITLRGPDQTKILAFLREQNRNAYVSPTVNGMTIIFDEESDEQDVDILDTLTRDFSEALSCTGLGVLNHDDSMLWLGLYHKGQHLSEFDSSERLGTRPSSFPGAFGVSGKIFRTWLILNTPHFLFLLETTRHAALANLLDLPRWAVGWGYRDLHEGGTPSGLERSELTHTQSSTA